MLLFLTSVKVNSGIAHDAFTQKSRALRLPLTSCFEVGAASTLPFVECCYLPPLRRGAAVYPFVKLDL